VTKYFEMLGLFFFILNKQNENKNKKGWVLFPSSVKKDENMNRIEFSFTISVATMVEKNYVLFTFETME
jgi:hypothetical protein